MDLNNGNYRNNNSSSKRSKKELLQLTEVPNKIRFLVEAAPNMASKVATLKKFYTDVQPLEGNNFIVTDEDGNRFQLDNKNERNLGDAIDLGKEAAEMVGSMIGAAKGQYGRKCCTGCRYSNECDCRFSGDMAMGEGNI